MASEVRRIRLRYAGTCVACRRRLDKGAFGWWDGGAKRVTCEHCHGAGRLWEVGVAGRSAQRDHDRRRELREGRVREAYPRFGSLLLRLTKRPQSTTVWQTGADG